MSRARAAAAGAVATTAWGLQEPLDRRVFRCAYSDTELLGSFVGRGRGAGFAVHAANGAAFGLVFEEVRRRTGAPRVALALGLATAEHVATWPAMALVDRELARSPRAFAQSLWRHLLFGVLLGTLSGSQPGK